MKQALCNTRMVYDLDGLQEVVDHLYDHLDHCRVVTLTGTLGTGKTTLARALLKKCGITEEITSPTFTCVNSYKAKSGMIFNHFDLYRIKSLNEFIESGFDEYLSDSNSKILIEWPGIIMTLLEKITDVCHINIDYQGDDNRALCCILKENYE